MLSRRLIPTCSSNFLFSSFSSSPPLPRRSLFALRRLSTTQQPNRQHQQQLHRCSPLAAIRAGAPHRGPSHHPRVQHHQLYSTMAAAIDPNGLADQLKALGLDKVEKYANCNPETNPMDIYRSHITDVMHEITGVDAAIIYPAVQWTQSLDKGDLMLAVPALRVKGKKPNELAEEWCSKFPESHLVEKPVAGGPFLSFFFKPNALTKFLIPNIRKKEAVYGNNPYHGLKDPSDPNSGKKTMLVEFSSPNIAKPFHAGHLRSTIIGGFLSKLFEGAGWEVTRINYLGDWGKQYGLLALAWEKWGDEAALKEDPINHLFNLYVRVNQDLSAEKEEIEAKKTAGEDVTELLAKCLDEQARQYFRRMTDGEKEPVDLWKRFRDLSIERYKKTYARLNITFDSFSGEANVPEADMEKNAKLLSEKGISEEDNGAVLIDYTKHVPGKAGKSLGKAVIRKRDGTALYLTRDITELLNREEKYHFDHLVYVIASAQDLHLKQLFKTLELLGREDIVKKVQHINFGLVLGMSTRKGTVKFLDDILRDVAETMHEVMRKNESKYAQIENPEAVADILGISSVMVQDMSGKRINNYTFNMEAMTSFEGDTGPYLQYAHARLHSIRRKAELSDEDLESADLSLLTEKHATELARLLAQWPDVVQNTLKTLEPTTVLTYLFKMTHALSSSYDHLRIVGSEKELKKARMALYDSARIVLRNGMQLLGLTPVERM